MPTRVEPLHSKVDQALQRVRRSSDLAEAALLSDLLEKSPDLSFHLHVPSPSRIIDSDESALNTLRRMMGLAGGYFVVTGKPYLPSNDAPGYENLAQAQLCFPQGRVDALSGERVPTHFFHTDLPVPVNRIFLVRQAAVISHPSAKK